MSDLAKRVLIAKTHGQLNHELPIMFYAPWEADKCQLWSSWLADPEVPTALRKNLGLYIHVPYCTQVCSFCYLEKRLLDGTVPSFMDVLLDEVDQMAPLFKDAPFRTVYLGGGTPGALTVSQLDRLFTRLKDAFNLRSLAEFSLETDLPSLTEDKLRCYQSHGLTRLSVGLQNLDPSVLAQNNRLHQYDIEGKMALLESYRFRDLNLDVIMGIPGSHLENLERTITRALAIKPTRISLYTFNPYEGYDFDYSDEVAVSELVENRRAQQTLAKRLIQAAEDSGALGEQDNLQLDDTMRLHSPLLGLGPSANNRMPFHGYYKNADSVAYLNDSNRITGWKSNGPDEELEFHVYNSLIRSIPIDLRQSRTLLGRLPSEIHAAVTSRLGDQLRFEDGRLYRNLQNDVQMHLALLRGLDVTRKNLHTIDFPASLEGLDEDRLLDVLIGY
jgi:coproporphyrinogen III oxidase-like Fe-S oxidoreductase